MTLGRAGAVASIVVVAVVAVVTARQLSAGETHALAADAAASRSDWPDAVAQARAAAEALAPGSPWPERGWIRLEAIGHDAEARGDDETALLAYGAMRAAALATRGPGSGWERRREQAESALGRVAAARREPTGPRVTAEAMLDALHAEDTPATLVVCALATALAATVGGLARLAWLGEAASRARVAQAVAAAGVVAYAAIALTR